MTSREQFVAVTDPRSSLEKRATELGFSIFSMG